MIPGLVDRRVATSRGEVAVSFGGAGPPVLLLHGYPQTRLMWHAVAPRLLDRYTVVAADLPGYGDSFRPVAAGDHAPHGKRALAADLVEAMAALDHERFAVVGHDRGGRVAYRMALDHPDRIDAVAVLDVVPTGEVWSRADAELATRYWHWGFLAQPAPLPERMIGADPDVFFDLHVRALGLGRAPGRYPPEVLDVYRRQLDDPEVVAAICEDYRAGATVDREDDDADRRDGRRIGCPVLTLWSSRGALPALYGDVLDVWKAWSTDVRGVGVDASHFLAEDDPAGVVRHLDDLLRDAHSRNPHPMTPTGPDTDPARPLQERAMTADHAQPADALAATLTRTVVQRAAFSVPGREIVQVRTEIPAGVASGWHTHPGEEVGYIVEGNVRMEIRDRPTLELHAGDGFCIPPDTPHDALDLGPGTGVMLSTYLVEPGRSLSAAAPAP